MENNMTLAYIAGFFDGEGFIGITRRKKKKSVNYAYYIQVAVGQKDGRIMDTLKDMFKGNIHTLKRDGSYFWSCSDRTAFDFLKQITPYLRYKKPQAEVAMSLYDNFLIRKKFNMISDEEIKRRELLYTKIRDLKRVFESSNIQVQRLNERTLQSDVIV